ncbi:putative integral membrane protein [Theileria parva strain Muguga]|uniref:Uncharacterized protein n=1 Tax=Theileria parva TaxID=5875 RepID=Q4MZA6_THEPA|nr:putative integral membrane protein [Theileria parva strain Muguga]EAN30777.1 putative integral membrane protein [Theileria parva strain Muguga]|eukprot:XP_763060.1 hypothetical protein [Theileria parva strain Muguga]
MRGLSVVIWVIIGIIPGIALNLNKSKISLPKIQNRNYHMINKFSLNDEFSTNIFKQQVINELRGSEEVLKGIIFKILNHFYEYVKYRFLTTFFNLYIINPFDIQMGNLLNTKLNNYYLTNKLNIPTYCTPLSFGLSYEKVRVGDGSESWLIKSGNKTNKAFVLMHGWFGNPQSTLPFLNTLKQIGVLSDYNVLILNLYDNSNIFENNVGLRGMKRLYDGMKFLHDNYNTTHFNIYTQSVSSISAILLYHFLQHYKVSHSNTGDTDDSVGTEDTENNNSVGTEMLWDMRGFGMGLRLDEEFVRAVEIDKLILESPVINVKQYLLNDKYYSNIINNLYLNNKYFSNFNEYINKLNICKYVDKDLLRRVNVLQGVKDEITTLKMLQEEFSGLRKIPNLFLFKNSGHIDLCKNDSKDYLSTVKYILKNPILRFFQYNTNKVNKL